jgi:DNA-nicking Smr family endonuclease
MNKRKGKSDNPPRSSSRQKRLSGFYTPFKDLDQHLVSSFSNDYEYSDKPPAEPPAPVPPVEETEEGLFTRAMAEVNPLPAGAHGKIPLRPPEKKNPRFHAQEELEAYTQLVDLVAGDGTFEISYSDEYIDGAVVGLSPEVLKKLRNGYFSYQDYLDLHGLNRQEAREETIRFVLSSFSERRRCVLIIPGRGLNSVDKEPVLKNNLVSWLMRAPLKRVVLAFASAKPCDGGWGAFYVLLRKNEHKTPLISPAG